MPRSAQRKSPLPQVMDVFGDEPVPVLAPAEDPEPDGFDESGTDPDDLADGDAELLDVPAVPAAVPAGVPGVPVTPEQQRIAELENALALERGRKDPDPEYSPVGLPDGPGNIIIHILDDGFTALGQTWYRGQELEFEPGSAAYRDTCDRFGTSWLELRHDEFAQVEKYGKVLFRSGPWPGKTYEDAAKAGFELLKPLTPGTTLAPSIVELQAAQEAELKRRRAAPRLSTR